MKQHITQIELGIFRVNNQDKYESLFNLLGYAFIPIDRLAEMLTIGKMIEILEDYCERRLTIRKTDALDWAVESEMGSYKKYEFELCDALWEAVKEVLWSIPVIKER